MTLIVAKVFRTKRLSEAFLAALTPTNNYNKKP